MACLAPDGKFCLFRKGKKSWVSGSVHPNYNLNGIKGDHLVNRINHYMSKIFLNFYKSLIGIQVSMQKTSSCRRID